jgi:hypothetical protein
MLDVIEHRLGSGALHVLDLCSGPASIGRRILERFPGSTVVITVHSMNQVGTAFGRHLTRA